MSNDAREENLKLNFVARQATARLSELGDADQIRLLEGLALLFDRTGSHAEAEQTRLAARIRREAREAQLLLGEMLNGEHGS